MGDWWLWCGREMAIQCADIVEHDVSGAEGLQVFA